MALVELQFHEQAFGQLLMREISRRRLPSPTLTKGDPAIVNRLLDKITAVSCQFTSQSTGQLTADIDHSVLTYDNAAVAQAAGSLQQPPTRQGTQRIQLTLSVVIDKTAPQPKPMLVYSSIFLKGGSIDLSDVAGFGAQAGAIVLQDSVPPGQGVVSIRLASDPADPLDDPVVDRIVAGADWTVFTPGSLIAAPFVTGLKGAVDDAVKPDPKHPDVTYEPGAAAAGAYMSVQMFGFPPPPYVFSSAEIVAVDACPVLDFDVTVTLQLIATFAANGPNLEITLKLTWDADSTWCQIGDFFILTPVAPFVIHAVADQQASDAVLGKAHPFEGFKEIGRDDNSITYLSKRFLAIPPRLKLISSQFTNDGLVVAGVLAPLQQGGGLQGWSAPPVSDLNVSCSPRRVTVRFSPAQVGLWNYDPPGGPPAVFFATFSPANAWVVTPGVSNSSQELLLNFTDPPGGRLPVGTATSVFLMTDCGLRWVDLGVIPADHAQPTTADMAAMISKCMAKSAGWKERVLSVNWLPRHPDENRGIPVVRQWLIGLEDLPRSGRIDVVAVAEGGRERSIGVVEGRSRAALQVTTDAHETLELRSSHDDNRSPVVVAQRWISPFATMRVEGTPVAIAAAGGLLGLRGQDGATHLINLGAGGTLHAHGLDSSGVEAQSAATLEDALGRQQRRGRETWNSAAQLDAGTVALVHQGALLLGTAGPLQTLLTD
jgi:hypothetical protein